MFSFQRAMPSSFFILLRFFLRVDDVMVRINDTRIYHEVRMLLVLVFSLTSFFSVCFVIAGCGDYLKLFLKKMTSA